MKKEGSRPSKAVYQCSGTHSHAPPPTSKPDGDARDALEKLVVENPSRKPLQLTVGQSSEKDAVNRPVRFLSEAFTNLDRVAYLRLKIL
jgi:hypothetical protein